MLSGAQGRGAGLSPTPGTGQGLRGEQKALQPEGERTWVLSGGPSSRGIGVLRSGREQE